MRAADFGDLFQHRRERRQAGAAGQQQQRPLDRAQVEATQRAGQAHAVAGLGQTGKEAAHQAAGNVADEEADLAILGQRTERIRAALTAARHLQVDVLAWQEGQAAQRFTLDRQGNGAGRQLAHIADLGLEIALLGFAQLRRCRDAQHAVGFGAHLAGQHVTLADFFCAKGVFDEVLTQRIAARLGLALAGAAGAVTAVQGDVDALPIGCIGNGFVAFGIDEAGDPVFEIECDLEAHVAPRGRACPQRALRHAGQYSS